MRVAREIICGLDYFQVISCAGMNMGRAADKLGVSRSHFKRVVHRNGMSHWFPDVRPRAMCLTKEDIVEIAKEGFVMKDSAAVLGVSYRHFLRLVYMWGLRGLFPASREYHTIAQKGYCS